MNERTDEGYYRTVPMERCPPISRTAAAAAAVVLLHVPPLLVCTNLVRCARRSQVYRDIWGSGRTTYDQVALPRAQ